MPPILIFANPISGRGRGKVLADSLSGRLRAMGYEPRVFFEPPATVTADAIPADAAAAIVIGGDGTLRAVARRLFETPAESGDSPAGPPLLLAPTGTANLMGQHLGIPRAGLHAVERIAAAVRKHDIVHLDAGVANGELFLLMVGVGIDADVVHAVDRGRTGPITKGSYLRPILSTFMNYAFPPLRVALDGRVLHDAAPAMAFVGNLPEYGAGFPILPHARGDDGLLDVCVLPCRSRSQAVSLLFAAAAGEHVHAPGVVYARGKEIRIDSPHAVPAQVDGEAAGHTPLEIGLLDRRIPFIVPVEA